VIDLMDALRASLETTAPKRSQPKSTAAESAPVELKSAQRKSPKKVTVEPEVRRKASKR
jgi:hypothetical protein